MHALSNYNNSNILIVTPESDLSADQQALNNNFKTVVTGYVPYTGAIQNVDLNGKDLGNLGGLAISRSSIVTQSRFQTYTNGTGMQIFWDNNITDDLSTPIDSALAQSASLPRTTAALLSACRWRRPDSPTGEANTWRSSALTWTAAAIPTPR